MQQSITLLGQAINATTFYRRKSILLALNNGNEATSTTWLRETFAENLAESGPNLFGESFMDSMKKTAKNQSKTIKQMLMTTPKPFPQSSSTHVKPTVGVHTRTGRFYKGKNYRHDVQQDQRNNRSPSRGKKIQKSTNEGTFLQHSEQNSVSRESTTGSQGEHTPSVETSVSTGFKFNLKTSRETEILSQCLEENN